MRIEDVQEWRRKRLQDAVEHAGTKVALGKALGYKDGSYIGQMLRGVRPIDEKTVLAIEQLPRLKGWFDQPGQPHAPGVQALYIDKPIGVGMVAQSIARLTRDLAPSRREKIAASFGALIRGGPDDDEAADLDALVSNAQLQAILSPSETAATVGGSAAVDKAFREAFYSIADAIKTKHGNAMFNDLRDGIEHRVAETLGLDISQTRRALHEGQSDQG